MITDKVVRAHEDVVPVVPIYDDRTVSNVAPQVIHATVSDETIFAVDEKLAD